MCRITRPTCRITRPTCRITCACKTPVFEAETGETNARHTPQPFNRSFRRRLKTETGEMNTWIRCRRLDVQNAGVCKERQEEYGDLNVQTLPKGSKRSYRRILQMTPAKRTIGSFRISPTVQNAVV